MIIYIHGWRTSGIETGKILKDYFGDQIVVPILDHDPGKDTETICNLVKEHDAIVMGSSLGGFYAFYVATLLCRPAILINPSFDPFNRLTEYCEFKKYDCNETFIWTPEKNEVLANMARDIKEYEIDPGMYHFYVAKDDELLDHSWIKNIFPNVREYDNCGHRFTRLQEILPEIASLHNAMKR